MTRPSLPELHQKILVSIVDKGSAPTIRVLAESLGWTVPAVRQSLRALEDYHGAVLHQHNDEIWIAHPFSLAPTNFLVRSKTREWWQIALGALSVWLRLWGAKFK